MPCLALDSFSNTSWININPSMDKVSRVFTVQNEITYQFPNLNGCTVELISNLFPHITGRVFT